MGDVLLNILAGVIAYAPMTIIAIVCYNCMISTLTDEITSLKEELTELSDAHAKVLQDCTKTAETKLMREIDALRHRVDKNTVISSSGINEKISNLSKDPSTAHSDIKKRIANVSTGNKKIPDNSQDTIDIFVETKIVHSESDIYALDLYESYDLWCERNNLRSESMSKFGAKLSSLGFIKRKTSRISYLNIAVKGEDIDDTI